MKVASAFRFLLPRHVRMKMNERRRREGDEEIIEQSTTDQAPIPSTVIINNSTNCDIEPESLIEMSTKASTSVTADDPAEISGLTLLLNPFCGTDHSQPQSQSQQFVYETEESSSDSDNPPAAPIMSPLSCSPFTSPTKTPTRQAVADESTPLLPNRFDTADDSSSSSTSTSTSSSCGIRAQSLILALAFFAVWTPQNLMAPNLTQMANFFHFTPAQRDAYLGANIALATGVLSLPISAIIGFLADMVPSRRNLFALTIIIGALASFATGLCQNYTQLYTTRFVNGGCMAGSVPIAFSLLGDLFHARDRNAASSGLTAMMGAGIISGQVFAGVVGDLFSWQYPFYVSAVLTLLIAVIVLLKVEEPVRGSKEKVLQDILKKGGKYDRKLTFKGFYHAMMHNQTNFLLLIQGFFTSVPWGIIFVFLNDYLSQEQGLSVPDATFLVLLFGIGSAAGGVAGGYLGQITTQINRSYMPIFMAISTLLGILPFLGLLDDTFHAAGLKSGFYAFMGGMIANLPGVNIRPIIINVNPPEMRGAALTAANTIINMARGIGPIFMTTTSAFFDVNRQFSFNVLLVSFWIVTAVILFLLAKTLPNDQDRMEHDLARYAKTITQSCHNGVDDVGDNDDHNSSSSSSSFSSEEDDLISIEDRITSFDADAARESLMFLGEGWKDIRKLSRSRSSQSETHHEEQQQQQQVGTSNSQDKRRGKKKEKNKKISDWRESERKLNGAVGLDHCEEDDDRGPKIDVDRGSGEDGFQAVL